MLFCDESRCYVLIINKEEFAEDMVKTEKYNFTQNVRQRLPDELWYGMQFHLEGHHYLFLERNVNAQNYLKKLY